MTWKMTWSDIRPGGEYYIWARTLRGAAQLLARRLRFKLKVIEVRPFDVYRGPYVRMTNGCALWWSPEDGPLLQYCFEGLGMNIVGDTKTLAEAIRQKLKESA